MRMSESTTFKYEGISSLLAFQLFRPCSNRQLRTQTGVDGGRVVTPNQKLGFRPCKPPVSLGPLLREVSLKEDSEEPASYSDSESSSSKPAGSEDRADHGRGRMRKGPYKKYTTDQKRTAIEMINAGKDIKTVSKQYNIPRRNLLRWRKNGCERKEGGGRPSDFIMEEKLFEMILRQEITSQRQIRELALSMTNFKKFKASKGWYVKFWRRFNEYQSRRGTQRSPDTLRTPSTPLDS